MESVISLKDIGKTYRDGSNSINVLNQLNFNLEAGDFVSIVGKSGSGKSTLLNMIGLLDNFDSGKYFFDGEKIVFRNDKKNRQLRNQKIGFVFQSYHLINDLTALENAILPFYTGILSHQVLANVKQQAKNLLSQLGLAERAHFYPHQLSGGEQQRVTIARALCLQPKVLLCDEPTGQLDKSTGSSIIDILVDLNRNTGTAIIMVTHDHEVAQKANKIFKLEDGKLHKI